jgi:hypothetical protein
MTRSRFMLLPRLFFALTLLSSLALFAQARAPASTETNDTKIDGIIKETQRQIGGKNLAGLVWWVPAEFWEESAMQQGSSLQQARETFGSLREYTVVIVLTGKIGIGNINWYSDNELRSNTSFHDADGQVCKPLTDVSSDAAGVISIIKPVMANILGPAGQNLQILFFPSKTRSGMLIADPIREGRFAISIENLPGTKPLRFEWLLPLTSLTPAKFCPFGKERVEANWNYCPWHGVKLLDNIPPAIPLVELKPKENKPQ